MDRNDDPPAEADEAVLDVSRLQLDHLLDRDDTPLSRSVRRIVESVDGPPQNYTAFGNTP